jgi:hypothetical protein
MDITGSFWTSVDIGKSSLKDFSDRGFYSMSVGFNYQSLPIITNRYITPYQSLEIHE